MIAAALALQQHAGSLFKNGMWVNAAIEMPNPVGQEGIDKLRAELKQMFGGSANSGKAIILPDGGKWNPLSGSPVDQEILAARRFVVDEVSRLYAVPPPILQALENGSFANVNDLIRLWGTGTVAQWARRIEAEFARSIFGGSATELVIDLSGLLRGNPAERWAAWKIAAEAGILTKNEIRESEGYNPLPGGDAFAAPVPVIGDV